MSMNLTLNRMFFILLCTFICFSCNKNEILNSTPSPVIKVEDNEKNIVYSSEYKYNLNVIYFVPNDVTPNAGYEERLSKIMIEGQNFFAKWMNHWGFGNKTFGLMKNTSNTRIKIHTIKGPESAAAYADDAPIKALVDDYFIKNPQEKSSDHYLILTATNKKLDQGEEFGHAVPFYGTGRYCYAVEYPGMSQDNLGKSGSVGEKATIYIGGLLHEMGHGINLPHNGPSVSKKNDPNFGMTLMGSGNYTYGKSPTYLSFFDAATLNNCQVFSKEVKSFYTGATNKITKINAKYENGEIIINGSYTVSNPVKHITFRNILDTDGAGYTSITFTQAASEDGTFSVKMPISEFVAKKNPTTGGDLGYGLEIFFHHENGNSSTMTYSYNFVNEVPVIDFGDRELLDRIGWEIIGFSNQQNSGYYAAKNVLDGNPNTYWHTSWDNPMNHPHFITIKTGNTPVTAKGVSINTRHDNSGNGGKIRDFKVEISNDGITWLTAHEGRMAMNGVQYFTFSLPKTFLYFKIVSLNDYENKFHATLSEVNLYN